MPTPLCGRHPVSSNISSVSSPWSRYTLPTSHKGQPAGRLRGVIRSNPGSSGVNQPERCPAISEAHPRGLHHTGVHACKPQRSPLNHGRGKFMTMLPISGNPDIDRGPLHSFAAAVLPTASREGCMVVGCPYVSSCRPALGPPSDQGRSCCGSPPFSGVHYGRMSTTWSVMPAARSC